jgi:hypothetical protein
MPVVTPVRTQIIVSRCGECPFFERGATHVLVDWLAKRDASSGTCKYNAVGLHFPMGRTHVPNAGILPTGCPLRNGDAVVQLAKDAS